MVVRSYDIAVGIVVWQSDEVFCTLVLGLLGVLLCQRNMENISMSNSPELVFKVASEAWEFEQVHTLNYQTFVEEIPQHQQNTERKLVDRFHAENIYVICTYGRSVVAMIALRDKRPLSLDEKIEGLEFYLPPFESILEYRLLAVKKEYRNTATFIGIMKKKHLSWLWTVNLKPSPHQLQPQHL